MSLHIEISEIFNIFEMFFMDKVESKLRISIIYIENEV